MPHLVPTPSSEIGGLLGGGIAYGSQTYLVVDHDVLYSSGSFGQFGFSDMETGASVVFQQNWAVNVELEKLLTDRAMALAIISQLRAQARSLEN